MQNLFYMTDLAYDLIDEIKSMTRSQHFNQDIEMINGHAGISPISVSPELYTVILQSIRLKKLTNGAIDICRSNNHEISMSKEIEVNPLLLSIYLPNSRMKISLGNIYALVSN